MREQITSRLSGRDNRMLPFETVRAYLYQQNPLYQGIQQVPIEQVVGSVGRYKEFTRHFLPLDDSIKERWVGVDSLARTRGWPPIELYQVGDVYFVVDGNHRLSVAQQLDMDTIEAHVWKYPESVKISPDDPIDEVLIRLEERRFMERTQLNDRFPDHNVKFTTPRRYAELLSQIMELKETLSHIDGEEMAFEDAVDAWYEIVYLPTVQIIRESSLLDEFPGRTEADLFVWLSKHQEGLQREYGEYDSLAQLAEMLVDIYGEKGISKLTRQVKRLLGNEEPAPLDETAVESNGE